MKTNKNTKTKNESNEKRAMAKPVKKSLPRAPRTDKSKKQLKKRSGGRSGGPSRRDMLTVEEEIEYTLAQRRAEAKASQSGASAVKKKKAAQSTAPAKSKRQKSNAGGRAAVNTERALEVKASLKASPKTAENTIERAAVATAISDRKTKKAAKRGKGAKPTSPLRIISLGGLQEIGKNMTVFEYGDDIVIIDTGLAFPDEDMPGVDLVIPDFSYLIKNAHKVRAVLITHGHEDHIGGVPYLLQSIDVPVYGTRLSLGILEGKLDENRPPQEPRLYTVEAGDVINLGVFKAEFIHVNHSIADACAIALRTPVGTVFHSGDFKLDVSPIDGRIMDLTRIGEIGKEGVELLLCESTNAERAGYTPSERTVGNSLERIFMQNERSRLIIATFSSNVHRVQQIINTSAKYGRKVAVLGRSMVNVIGAAVELGYMELPDDVLIDVTKIKQYPPEKITLITTGSQGEPMSALYRIAFSEHDKVKLSSSDVVVLSSSAIPGNEKLVGKIINALVKNGVKVVNDSVEDVHVSGHACREEIKLLMALTRPKYFMPIHGEYRHLYANRDIAEFMGISPSDIFISEIGRVLELTPDGAAFAGSVPSGNVLVDGAGVGDIGSVVLRDRKHLAEDGLVVVVAGVDIHDGLVVSGPDIVSRGFVYVKESTDLMDRTKRVAQGALERVLEAGVWDFTSIKNAVKDDVAKFIFKETKRKPMILPIILNL